jgi:hypothetical protein
MEELIEGGGDLAVARHRHDSGPVRGGEGVEGRGVS